MVKLFLGVVFATVASAAGFTLTVGPPVAAGTATKVKKGSSAFAVRLEECDDLGTAQITGTVEGLVNGARTSGPITLDSVGTPGVYLVSLNGQQEGVWAVNLSATCGGAKAGAIVPVNARGFVRESVKIFPRPATNAEVSTVLESLNKR